MKRKKGTFIICFDSEAPVWAWFSGKGWSRWRLEFGVASVWFSWEVRRIWTIREIEIETWFCKAEKYRGNIFIIFQLSPQFIYSLWFGPYFKLLVHIWSFSFQSSNFQHSFLNFHILTHWSPNLHIHPKIGSLQVLEIFKLISKLFVSYILFLQFFFLILFLV